MFDCLKVNWRHRIFATNQCARQWNFCDACWPEVLCSKCFRIEAKYLFIKNITIRCSYQIFGRFIQATVSSNCLKAFVTLTKLYQQYAWVNLCSTLNCRKNDWNGDICIVLPFFHSFLWLSSLPWSSLYWAWCLADLAMCEPCSSHTSRGTSCTMGCLSSQMSYSTVTRDWKTSVFV